MFDLIGIIGAMEEEVVLIKETMVRPKIHRIGGVDFYQGILGGKTAVLCKAGVGKVNAAYAASVLILYFRVDALIFTGVAGAASPALKVGGIVVATDCLYHDMDASAMGWKLSEIPDGSISLFPCHAALSETLCRAALNAGLPPVYRGRLVTGDQFIADTEKVQELHRIFKAFAVDMEGAAVAHVALKSKVPCAIIRSISDKADDGAGMDYSNFMHSTAQNSAALVAAGIRLL